jgi:hypothetical protein
MTAPDAGNGDIAASITELNSLLLSRSSTPNRIRRDAAISRSVPSGCGADFTPVSLPATRSGNNEPH